MKKFTCPHCGEPTFTPLQKAMAGSLRTRGKPCPGCGKRCCNGMASIYFSTAVSAVAFVAIMAIFLLHTENIISSILIGVIIVASFLLNFLFNLFFGKLVEPLRTMS